MEDGPQIDISCWILGKNSSSKEWSDPGGSGGTVPGGVPKCGDMALRDVVQWAVLVVGGQLDERILEAFSNITACMIQ